MKVLTIFGRHVSFVNKTASKNVEQVVKVIWLKAASPPHMDGSVVFARWRQCASHI